MGLWLLSESMRTWNLRGTDVDLGEVLVAAAALPAGGPRIDPNDPAFLPPGDMPERITAACRAAGTPLTDPRPAAVVRCILDSLAVAFAAAVDPGARSSPGSRSRSSTSSGGGSQNTLLCQLTADAARRPVVAGTGRGHRAGQPAGAGPHPRRRSTGDLAALRKRVRAAARLQRYQPRT